jgi:hypothetical protein
VGAQERCDFADDYARLRLRLQVLGVQLTTQRLAVRCADTPATQPPASHTRQWTVRWTRQLAS